MRSRAQGLHIMGVKAPCRQQHRCACVMIGVFEHLLQPA